jgi:hypothetical protein
VGQASSLSFHAIPSSIRPIRPFAVIWRYLPLSARISAIQRSDSVGFSLICSPKAQSPEPKASFIGRIGLDLVGPRFLPRAQSLKPRASSNTWTQPDPASIPVGRRCRAAQTSSSLPFTPNPAQKPRPQTPDARPKFQTTTSSVANCICNQFTEFTWTYLDIP